MGHVGIAGGQLAVFFFAHHGVDEERAGVAPLGRVGQLGPPDVDHQPAQLFGRGVVHASPLHFLLQRAVRKHRRETARQAEYDVRHDVAAVPFAFEEAAAIAVPAFVVREYTSLARSNFDCFDAIDKFLHFFAIRTDVLHGGSSHLAGNEREVLDAVKVAAYAAGHKVVPHLAGAHAKQHGVGVAARHVDTANGRVENGAGKIAGEEQVAARTYVEKGLVGMLAQHGQGLMQLVGRFIFDETAATGVDAECVVMKQGIIFVNFHVVSFQGA